MSMPKPMAVCLEDLDPKSPAERYLRCVAVGGRQPGLRVDAHGTVLWRSDEAVACELWVSADEKMILYRPEGATPSTVSRAGRTLDVPEGKPVVLLGGDEFAVGPRRFRLHVHGPSPAVVEPSYLPVPEPKPAGGVRQAAAAVALGAVLGGSALIQVRCHPPAPMPPTEPPPGEGDAGNPPEQDAEEIEVRVQPPVVAPPPDWEPTPPPPPEPEPVIVPRDDPIEVRDFPPGAPASPDWEENK
jgi:hypothetical protein